MNEQLFKDRTKKLALGFIELVEALPRTRTADVIAKFRIVEEEADESVYWMELLVESKLSPPTRMNRLLQETDEIIAMTVASVRTLQRRHGNSPINRKSKIANLKSLAG